MKRYSKQGLWSLFLTGAFPLHVWTIVLAFMDFSWIAQRTNSWDAIGVVSYALIFAFIESLLVFLVVVLLGFLISKKWDEDRRIALMGLLIFITSLWAILSYLYFMLNWSVPKGSMLFMAGLEHPLRFLYIVSLVTVGPTVALPAYFVLRSETFFRAVKGFFERLSLLTLFYLFFDIAGLIVVIVRNV